MEPGGPTEAQSTPAQSGSTTIGLPLPPPPPPPSPPVPAQHAEPWTEQPKLAGQLTSVWRFAFGFGWAATVVGYAAVWESSRVIGLSTWWLGADSQPRNLFLQLLPFYGPILVTIAAISDWRYVPYAGIVVAAAGAAIGAGDLGRVRWLAVVELVLAGGALCISIASLAGMYRPARAPAVEAVAVS